MLNIISKTCSLYSTGLEFAVETLKSFILTMALIENHLTVEKAVHLSRLELGFQVCCFTIIRHWLLEWTTHSCFLNQSYLLIKLQESSVHLVGTISYALDYNKVQGSEMWRNALFGNVTQKKQLTTIL